MDYRRELQDQQKRPRELILVMGRQALKRLEEVQGVALGRHTGSYNRTT
jgi:hypothetical protein